MFAYRTVAASQQGRLIGPGFDDPPQIDTDDRSAQPIELWRQWNRCSRNHSAPEPSTIKTPMTIRATTVLELWLRVLLAGAGALAAGNGVWGAVARARCTAGLGDGI
jgi:hypothetical protein